MDSLKNLLNAYKRIGHTINSRVRSTPSTEPTIEGHIKLYEEMAVIHINEPAQMSLGTVHTNDIITTAEDHEVHELELPVNRAISNTIIITRNAINQATSSASQALAHLPLIANIVTPMKQVNWQNGESLMNGLQASAKGYVPLFSDMNNAAGRLFNNTRLMGTALKISKTAPPSALIILQAGKFLLNTSAGVIDITNLTNEIRENLNYENYAKVLVLTFKLMVKVAQYYV